MNAFGVIRSSKCAPDDYACQEREKLEWLKTLQPSEIGPEPEAMTPEEVRSELERREAEMEARFGQRRVAQGHFARRWPTRGEHGFGHADASDKTPWIVLGVGAAIVIGVLISKRAR